VERSKGEQGDDEEYILVKGGEGQEEPGDNEEHILLQLKTIYRMMQGAYNWFYLLNDMFAILRYYQSKADSCVQSHLINGKFTLMSTHTDDVFGVSTTEDSATEPKTELDRCFEIKDLETLSIILGMKIFQDSVTQLDRYRSHRRHTSSEGWNASEWPTATPNQPHYPRTLTSAITYIPRLRITGYS